MQNMNLLLSKTPPSDICDHVLPMVYRALEANTPQIQVRSLDGIEFVLMSDCHEGRGRGRGLIKHGQGLYGYDLKRLNLMFLPLNPPTWLILA